jgi:hypothetical protein
MKIQNNELSNNKVISDEMKKRMTELETQIALQSENINKISLNSNEKEEKLNNDITDYINQINDLKNEMEVLNNIIINLTEEKENNAIKITNLLHENEKLKQNIKENNVSNNENCSEISTNSNNKKYEEIILKLKKNMLNLKEENKTLEEVILKQESEINQLSSRVNEVENVLIKKEKELEESIEYSAKLTSSINFHKNEIIKIKQKQSDNNKIDKNSEVILTLQKDLQNMKNNLEAKENKLNILSSNNKVLQDKLNKLTQSIKNELNYNNGNNNSKYNNKNKNNIHSSYNNYYTNKITINKPQSQLKNKTTRVSEAINPISSNMLPKNNTLNDNKENYKNNYKIIQNERSPIHNKQNIDEKKLYIISKHKIKSKTPGKLISCKHQLIEHKPDIVRQNIEIINKNNEKTNGNHDNIYSGLYNKQKIVKNSKININEKYKQIESRYKNDKKEITKEDTLFNEEDINNLNIKKEIISPYIQIEEDIDSIPILNNMNSRILKNKKEGRNTIGPINKKNIKEQTSIMSQEKEFPIIESYCMLLEKDNQNKSNCITNDNNYSQNILLNNDKEKNNESKIEAKQIQDLKEHVNKILNEF